jgi:hypothetical protein
VPSRIAEIFTVDDEAAGFVLMAKAAVVFPAGIVMLTGAMADGLLLEIKILSPPEGASELNVTVPVVDSPRFANSGFKVKEISTGGFMVIVENTAAPPAIAFIVARVCVLTAVVCTLNVAVELPAGTVIDDGGVAEIELLDRITARPFVPAIPFSVIVPLEKPPPKSAAGLIEIELSATG